MNVSLNMLLLAFFIALNSIAVIDDEHIKKALGSLIGSIRVLPAGVSPRDEGGSQLGSPSAVPIEQIYSLQSFLNELEKFAVTDGFGEGFGIQTIGEYTIMTLSDDILFKPDTLKINRRIESFLKQIGLFFDRTGQQVKIKGHTDNSPPPSRFNSDWEYSGAKALALLKFFTERLGVSPKNLAVIAYGGSRPLFPNNTKDNRKRNQRVEIVFGEDF